MCLSQRAVLAVTTAAAISILVAGESGAGAEAQARRLSLSEAVALALRQNVEVRQSEVEADRAGSQARGALGELGPRLHVDANIYQWNSPFSIAVGSGSLLLREATTSMVTVSGTQPLLGLLPRIARYQAQSRERTAAQADVEAARAATRLRVTETYLGALEAAELERIAARTVTEAEEQVDRARALVENGRLLDADLLRAQVSLARARLQLLEAATARQIAHATLAAILGLSVESELALEPVDVVALPPLPALIAVEAQPLAARARPELRAATARADAARAQATAAVGGLLPELDVTGGYQHTEGLTFYPRDAGFVAGVLSWDFWSWGARWEALKASRARAEASRLEAVRRRRDVALETATAYAEARKWYASVEVARAAVAQAEEAYRVTRVQFANGRATTTDLLDAQLAEEGARVRSAVTAYRFLRARAALERAVGVALPAR